MKIGFEKPMNTSIKFMPESVPDCIHLLNIPNDEVLDMYQAMDVFILTSKRESFGRTAIEAMAQGTVVFGTPVDGLPEVLGDKLYLYEDADQGC